MCDRYDDIGIRTGHLIIEQFPYNMPTLYQRWSLVGTVVSRFTLFANVKVTMKQR